MGDDGKQYMQSLLWYPRLRGTTRLCDIKGTIGVAVNERKRCEFIPWVGLYHEIHNGGANSCGDEVLEKIGDLITTL